MICQLYLVVAKVLQLYTLVMLVYAVVSWVPSIRGRWTEYVARLVEPVLVPVRRIIPPIGGLDISFIVVILVIGFVINLCQRYAYACSF